MHKSRTLTLFILDCDGTGLRFGTFARSTLRDWYNLYQLHSTVWKVKVELYPQERVTKQASFLYTAERDFFPRA